MSRWCFVLYLLLVFNCLFTFHFIDMSVTINVKCWRYRDLLTISYKLIVVCGGFLLVLCVCVICISKISTVLQRPRTLETRIYCSASRRTAGTFKQAMINSTNRLTIHSLNINPKLFKMSCNCNDFVCNYYT